MIPAAANRTSSNGQAFDEASTGERPEGQEQAETTSPAGDESVHVQATSGVHIQTAAQAEALLRDSIDVEPAPWRGGFRPLHRQTG